MSQKNFLLEIGCEELPPSSLLKLSHALAEHLESLLTQEKLSFGTIKSFASPQRLAIIVCDLQTETLEKVTERQGPSIDKAFDKEGTPTLACIGFARSCGIQADELQIKETPKGKRVFCRIVQPGNKTADLLPGIINAVIKKLPIPKPMRWGNHEITFIRPVHWAVMMLGSEIVQAHILGVNTSNQTQGHRFHRPHPITISNPETYPQVLHTQGKVIADFEQRKNIIHQQVNKAAGSHGQAIVDSDLLTQVTAVVEWPVALCGQFDKDYLKVPAEALITAMKVHQKCFPIVNNNQELLPYFILVSNIESKDPNVVIHGNERVINARLSDAAFFYHKDLSHPLSENSKQLSHVVFEKTLGTMADKVKRIVALSEIIAEKIGEDPKLAARAAGLAKCDLLSDMVYEFPELQGIMGYHYAKHDNEPDVVSIAIKEHYLPKFSGDKLPTQLISCCVALADRLDTLIGILGINKAPTGDKDPFALRRAALSVARILIEKELPIDLFELLTEAAQLYDSTPLPNTEVCKNSFSFIMERLRAWYLNQGVIAEIFAAVKARNPTSPLDFDHRIKALQLFQNLPEANCLAAANKRVKNILKKQLPQDIPNHTNSNLFEFEAEHQLATSLATQSNRVDALYNEANYTSALTELASLKEPVDNFFNDVMIMVEDPKVRGNRLALLLQLQQLFTQVADLSLLP